MSKPAAKTAKRSFNKLMTVNVYLKRWTGILAPSHVTLPHCHFLVPIPEHSLSTNSSSASTIRRNFKSRRSRSTPQSCKTWFFWSLQMFRGQNNSQEPAISDDRFQICRCPKSLSFKPFIALQKCVPHTVFLDHVNTVSSQSHSDPLKEEPVGSYQLFQQCLKVTLAQAEFT